MNKVWLSTGFAGALSLILVGCGATEATSSSIPTSFPPSVKKAMTAYKTYKATPLLVPTVVPQPSKSSAPMEVESTANDPSFDKYTYLLSFVETDSSTHKPILPKVAYVTGSREYKYDDTLKIFSSFSQYNSPNGWGPGTSQEKGEITLAHGIKGSTDIITANRTSTGQSFPPVSQVTWHEGKWTFQARSTTTSLRFSIRTANDIITHCDSTKLPTPWKNAFVVISENPGNLFAHFFTHDEQIDTIVSWDESFGTQSRGKYQVRTSNLCANPIFTALNMAASMKPYSFT